MNNRNAPLSNAPLSPIGSEWSGISKYQTLDTDSPYSPNPINRGQLATPPVSGASNGMMNGGGFPPRGSISGGGNIPRPGPEGPSPPASIARSSIQSRKDESFESVLSEHYIALKRYLTASLRDEKGNPRPNKARDKLLRLSPVQFQELSTDVFDELLRRQSGRVTPNGGSPDGGPPPYLLPKDTFHPKRNQARQKLSTLPPARFRDLATDVFYELERRFPRFTGGDISRMGSPASMRGPPSRNGTPVNGGSNRMRRPSDASSIAGYSMRSESRNGPRPSMNGLNIPPSPIMPPNDYGRPTPKTFASNTIVPNKSTMVEDDETGGEDNDDDGDAFALEGAAAMGRKKSVASSEADKKIIESFQLQVTTLQDKLDVMEGTLKQKDDDLNKALGEDRARTTSSNLEMKKLEDLKLDLENKVASAQNLNESLQSELDKVRASQMNVERDLRSQIDGLREANATSSRGGANSDLERENQELRAELQEQQEVTDEVRREAQEFLREMRMLSERSGSSYDREEQLSNTVNKLEEEVRDWRNRYARTKTQLRSLRAGSIGLTIQPQVQKYLKDSDFTEESGLVKDVHITKFQISIDELLQIARRDDPSRVTDFMKAVIVNVRAITQDVDEAHAQGEAAQVHIKLKGRVSATANNLITASKNFAAASGLSPVSLLDAAASHLVTSVVELVRTVKIRPTPAGELEDDDDGHLDPVDTTGYFPVRITKDNNVPPPFQGLRTSRTSADSSMYSPVNSPRESTNMRPKSSGKETWASRQRSLSKSAPLGNGLNTANGINGITKSLPMAPMGVGFGIRAQDSDVENLKVYLEDETAALVQNIQSLVSSIRSDAGITAIMGQINAIASVVGKAVSSTEETMASTGRSSTQADPILKKLSSCRQRLVDAGERGQEIAAEGLDDAEGEREWKQWTQSLPPIAFEIARETKELVLRVDIMEGEQGGRNGDDDFS
ncbi:hypothetical protein BJ878DRAFT_414196 [Calycina marina]|uniref:GIT Spa2 homology (SHD) domain-containing protein n=1 Tax=Calycina marina TaxID=1763456 RepID=A0A9P7Z9G4_9HELO|nr:hypothetical protein BJ878DRAFT_414196 [Calycina marina]